MVLFVLMLPLAWAALAEETEAELEQGVAAFESAAVVEELVKQLGADEFTAREQASEALWEIGKPAMKALEAAAKVGDYEVVWRAEQILKKFRIGIFPDTPKDIRGHLQNYSEGNDSAKRLSVQALLALGHNGFKATLHLLEHEEDEKLKEYIRSRLMSQVSQFAPHLIRKGELDEAETYLRLAALNGRRSSLSAYAAYVTVRGKLDQAIKDLKKDDAALTTAERRALAWLYRGKGDLAAAIKVLGDEEQLKSLRRDLLIEAGRWKELLVQIKDIDAAPTQQIGYWMTYARLAGDREQYEKLRDVLMKRAKVTTDTQRNAIPEILMLNDEFDLAFALKHEMGHWEDLLTLYAHQHRYDEWTKLFNETAANEKIDVGRRVTLQMQSLPTWRRLGRDDMTNACLTAALDESDALIAGANRYPVRQLLVGLQLFKSDEAAVKFAAKVHASDQCRRLREEV